MTNSRLHFSGWTVRRPDQRPVRGGDVAMQPSTERNLRGHLSGMRLTYFESASHGDFIALFKIQPRCLLLWEIYDFILAGGLSAARTKGRSERVIVQSSHRRKKIQWKIWVGRDSLIYKPLITVISFHVSKSSPDVSFIDKFPVLVDFNYIT